MRTARQPRKRRCKLSEKHVTPNAELSATVLKVVGIKDLRSRMPGKALLGHILDPARVSV